MRAVSIQINLILPDGVDPVEIEKKLNEQIPYPTHSSLNHFTPSIKKAGGRKLIRDFLRERDGDLCCWCNEPMDFDNLGSDTPRVPTFEHVVRRADGGENSFENLKLAHKKCNNERHKK